MDMEELIESLLAGQKEMLARFNANHKEIMAKIDTEMEAIRAETKVMREKRMDANRKV
jgi:hypothetical protein